ncbi:Uncharacterised protein [Achromobacter xylosoxidans]|uniref:hypothetical protein n=1 Tax=Alcaligenes xylosoxydans xylosoxydans TaxID=85698 RepID=UPI0006BF595D|nr:hypothetical protein [Achromobacter xylosoxidans]CUI39921.1 Uncharacterised protein [Achromobacter xylosoxidans]
MTSSKTSTPSSSPGKLRAAGQARSGAAAAASGKVLPPQAPVDVPRPPPRPDAATPDEAARDGRRVADDQTESNWADNAQPQPRAKNARSSIL